MILSCKKDQEAFKQIQLPKHINKLWPTYLERLKEADTSEPKEIWIHHLTNEFEKNYTAKKITDSKRNGSAPASSDADKKETCRRREAKRIGSRFRSGKNDRCYRFIR